jgi:hypothetical protein
MSQRGFLREASLALFACFVSFISLISFLFCLAKVVNMAGLDRDCSAPAFPTEKEVHFGDWITVGPQSMRRRDDPSSPVRRVVVVAVLGYERVIDRRSKASLPASSARQLRKQGFDDERRPDE